MAADRTKQLFVLQDAFVNRGKRFGTLIPAATATDVVFDKPPLYLIANGSGTVHLEDSWGNQRSFAVYAGQEINFMAQAVLAATDVDILPILG